MSVRDLISVGLIVIVPVVAEAQPPTDAAAVPRTAWGAPDLEGVWDFNTRTPVERRFERAERDALPRWRQPDFPPPDGVGAYNGFWTDTPTARSERTSQIVDPPDGRIPPLMPGVPVQVGSVWADLAGRRPVRYRSGGIGADGPEDRGLAVRCLVGFNSGPPMVPIGYNNNMQLFQTSDYVVILTEMVHNARIVHLDGRSPLPEDLRQWMGAARGHWEGDTLVIDTTNFTDRTSSFSPTISTALGTGNTLNLTERFRRVDAETLLYEYTVTDPVTFGQPFTGAISMRQSEGQIYEFACHEGHRAMANILSGARAEERRGP